MLNFTGSLKVYVATEFTDLRKSFNGLYAQTVNVLKENPQSGALFVFVQKSKNCSRLEGRLRRRELTMRPSVNLYERRRTYINHPVSFRQTRYRSAFDFVVEWEKIALTPRPTD